MKIHQFFRPWRTVVMVGALNLVAVLPALGQTIIKSIDSTQQTGVDMVRIELSNSLTELPKGFILETPPRIAIDLPGAANGLGRSLIEVNQGNLRSAQVVQSGERTRIVLNLRQPSGYRAQLQDKALLLLLEPGPQAGAVQFEGKPGAALQPLKDIEFRLGQSVNCLG